jgi:alkanesulfonate monooxygenase SsuD/methylene tetrahydromethanopterin reductase-like flavin-dependent oxidoreductase (luciferase family)
MKFGTTVPMRGPLAHAEAIRTIAEQTEAMEFSHISVTDHLIVPRRIDSHYPYTSDGAFPGEAEGFALEQFSIMAYLTALTRTAKLITAITVVPHRGAVQAAKTIATIDYLSGGRTVLRVGAGWMREEFDALNIPPFDERGRVTDEYLFAYKKLWTKDAPEFHGTHIDFANISFEPKPVQRGGPPHRHAG